MAIITNANGRLSVKNLTGDQLPDLPASRPGRKYWDLTVKAVILADPDLGPFLSDVAWDAATGSVTFSKTGSDGTDILAASTPWNGEDAAWRGELKKLQIALDKFLNRCKASSEWSDIVPDTTGFCLPDIGERDFYRRCALPDGSNRLVVIWGLRVGKGRKDVKFIVDNPPPVVTVPSPAPAPQPPQATQPKPVQPLAQDLTLTALKITRPSLDTSHFEAVPDVNGAVYSFVVADKTTGASMPQKVSIKGCAADVQLPPGAYSIQVRAFRGAQSSNILRQDFVIAAPKARGKFCFVPWLILLFLLVAVGAFFAIGYRFNVYKIPYVADYDTNKNGLLDKTEEPILVKEYDSNSDGKIDVGEGKQLEEDLKTGTVSSTPYSVKQDTNKDGKIDRTESQCVLADHDKDRNGMIDTQERKAIEDENKKLVAADKQHQDSPVPYLIIFDTDDNKALSDDERKEALKKYDEDNDGILNLHESKKAETDNKKTEEETTSAAQAQADTSNTNKMTSPAVNGSKTNSLPAKAKASSPSAKKTNGNPSDVPVLIVVMPDEKTAIDVTPTFDFVIDGNPKRVGESGEFNVTFKLMNPDLNAIYMLTNEGTELPFKEDRVTVPMKAGERQVTVLEKNGDRSCERSHLLEVSDKGFKTINIKEDKGGDVKLKELPPQLQR